MKSVTTFRFRQALERLPLKTQAKARHVYQIWKTNPYHPSLNFKQIHSVKPVYSIRIGLGTRALGVLEEDTIVWFWIGTHEEYNQFIKSL